MTLRKWLDQKGWTNAEAAKRLKVSGEAVRLWRMEGRTPSAVNAAAISKLTKGEVRYAA